MERTAVKSKLAKTLGHDPVTNMTEVEFHNGVVYQIDEMTADEHATFASGSIGKNFQNLKATKTVRRVPVALGAEQQVSER